MNSAQSPPQLDSRMTTGLPLAGTVLSRAHVTQIMNMLILAPDIREEILFLPSVISGRNPIHLRQFQSIALVPDWRTQRKLWSELSTDAIRA